MPGVEPRLPAELTMDRTDLMRAGMRRTRPRYYLTLVAGQGSEFLGVIQRPFRDEDAVHEILDDRSWGLSDKLAST